MQVTFEKSRVNVWNIGGFVVAIFVTAFGWGVTYSRMNEANATTQHDVDGIKTDVKDIRGQLPAINALQFQMSRASDQIAEDRARIDNTNNKLDKVVETFGNKLDSVLEKINKLNINVEVLNDVKNNGKAAQ